MQTDRLVQIQLFLFSLPKDSGLSALSFCLSACLLGAHLHQGGRAINPVLRRLPSDDTDYNSSLSTVRDESHPPISSKNTPSIRKAANLSFLCERGEHFKILKGQAMPWTYASIDVSSSFYGSRSDRSGSFTLEEGWIISIGGDLSLSGQAHRE